MVTNEPSSEQAVTDEVDTVGEAGNAGVDVSTLPEPYVSLSDDGKRNQAMYNEFFSSFSLFAARIFAAHLQVQRPGVFLLEFCLKKQTVAFFCFFFFVC